MQGILTSNLSLLDQPPDSPLSSTDYTEYNQMLWMATKWNACSNLRKGINNIYFSYCSLLFTILFNPTRIWNNLQVTAATQLKLETHGSFSKLQVTFTFSSFYNMCVVIPVHAIPVMLSKIKCAFLFCHTNKRDIKILCTRIGAVITREFSPALHLI